MITYNDLYETLRKEKYSESLQPLTNKFLLEFKEYLEDKKTLSTGETNLFHDSDIKSKKQLENSITLFRELMLKRKKKILNLVFVAAETGIMKKDYENMLPFERKIFDNFVKLFEESDKDVYNLLHSHEKTNENYKMIIIKNDIDQFMDSKGNFLGPFKSKQLINLDSEVAQILVNENKAVFVDES